MNPLESQLKALAKFLTKEKIKYAILGGMAVSIYGEPRLTVDIDVNILFDKRKADEFLKKSKKYGFYPFFSKTKEMAAKTGVIPTEFKKTKIRCDFITAENILEYEAIKRSKLKKIGSIKVRLVTPEDLIIHKIASSRPRDREDLKGILIRQKGKLDLKYVKTWLRKIDKANKSRLCDMFCKII